MINQLKPLLVKLTLFSKNRLGFNKPPRLFLRNDTKNSQQALGKTAFYDPQQKSVTLFISNRHPKDILRSFAHELVHHCQNERGDLSPDKMTSTGPGYAQECPHMRKMEKEAYLKGNMCFRDWEDTIQDKDKILIKIAESKFLKENKTIATKINKETLKDMIVNILNEMTEKEIQENGCNKPKAGRRDDKELEEAEETEGEVVEEDVEELEEGHGAACSHCEGKGCPKCEVRKEGEVVEEEIEELEEKKSKKKKKKQGKYDDNDGVDERCDYVKCDESKIQTPEQENTLYEQRFAPKNNRLFEKLLKEWAK